MTTIPQVARAMREILTTTAAAAGRVTRFVQRTAPRRAATFSQPWVLGWLGKPQAPLAALTPPAAAWGVELRPPALAPRFTAAAAAWRPPLLLPARARGSTAALGARPLRARLPAV